MNVDRNQKAGRRGSVVIKRLRIFALVRADAPATQTLLPDISR